MLMKDWMPICVVSPATAMRSNALGRRKAENLLATDADAIASLCTEDVVWIDPDDSNRMVVGNDGGVYLSANKGGSWRFVDNLPFAQFYHVSVVIEHLLRACVHLLAYPSI